MTVTKEEIHSGTVEVLDLEEWGFRRVDVSTPVAGSNPPQFRAAPRLRGFAKVRLAGGNTHEVVRSLHATDAGKDWADDIAKAKTLTQAKLCKALMAAAAAELGDLASGDV